jgi:hypothetical protein
MEKEELYMFVESVISTDINSLFMAAYTQVNATTGDITPEQSIKLETIKQDLVELISEVAWQNRAHYLA